MGVNSHQMSIVWCLTRRKGTNNYRRNGADEMVDRIDEMLADRIVDEMADRIDETGDRIDEMVTVNNVVFIIK